MKTKLNNHVICVHEMTEQCLIFQKANFVSVVPVPEEVYDAACQDGGPCVGEHQLRAQGADSSLHTLNTAHCTREQYITHPNQSCGSGSFCTDPNPKNVTLTDQDYALSC